MFTARTTVWSLVAIIGALVVLYVSQVNREPPPPPAARAVVLTGGADAYWKIAEAGAKAAAARYDTDLTMTVCRNLVEQNEALAALDVGSIDGLAVCPMDPENQTESLKLLSQKIHLVTFDSDAPESRRLCYIGTNNYAAGRLCARLVREAVPGDGKVAILMGSFKQDNNVERYEGFQEEMAHPGASEPPSNHIVLEPLVDEIDLGACRANIERTLEENPDLACFVGTFGYHGAVLLDVLKEAGKLGAIQLVVFDESPEVLDGIEAGHIYASVVQDPFKYGYEAVRLLSALQMGQSNELPIAGRGSALYPCEAVKRDNLGEFRARLKQRLDSLEAPRALE